MNTEVVDVLPSWTISSTSTTATNVPTLATLSSTVTSALERSVSSTSVGVNKSNTTSAEKQNNGNLSDSSNEANDVEDCGIFNSCEELHHMTPRSPATSLTSLPPLPDLIPIRKSLINHQATAAPTGARISPGPISSAVNLPLESCCTEEDRTSEANNDCNELSSHDLPGANLGEDTQLSPAGQLIEIHENGEESHSQHSNETEQEFDVAARQDENGQMNGNSTIDNPEENNSAFPEKIAKETMTPAAIIPEDNQSTALSTEQDALKKRGRTKPGVGRLSDNSEIIQHRKSDRRRVARDIFFLFEERPANRRKAKKGKKRPPGRPRNVVVETSNSIKQAPSVEGNSNATPVKKQVAPVKIDKPTVAASNSTAAESLVPRVNPIFLWAKQDGTRIVEVRCEDYDKRNRIRLTKTPNGWKAIPRTDSSSSRVVKLLPNPLVRVKQELQMRPDLLEKANTNGDIVRRMKKNKKKKKKKKKRKDTSDQEDQSEDDVRKLLSSSPKDVIVYESTNHERDEVVENNSEPLRPMELDTEPNNNDMSAELTKNLTQISDDIELDMPFMHHVQNETPMMTLCPQTGVFQAVSEVTPSATVPPGNDHMLSSTFDPTEVGCHDSDANHLKDLLDNADLLQHCDNAMSGAELLDSLVKRGCEDNHISDDEESHPHQTHHLHNSQHHANGQAKNNPLCLPDDFENEEDDTLMQPEPVEDIISRLGESLAASPKCLSFNEAGEIEGLHGELFQTSTHQDPFNRTALEELSITIKDLEKSSETFCQPTKAICDTNQRTVESTTIVSPDSCADELPKDLTCKKTSENISKPQPPHSQPHVERSISRSSDAIQSPQPSGLPAVPPSPDLMHSKNKNMFLDQLLSNSSTSPKIFSPVTITPVKVTNSSVQQKEPLDLGKHRKSASPTVSCSEEAKRAQPVTPSDSEVTSEEPLHKKIKTEPEAEERSHTATLIEMLSSGKDPDPLTQLRLLIRNPEWKVPDPIVVPKDRLSAVLASPAREIPLLLTTRPELRIPEAFAYQSILQDPDILVISLDKLEAILHKQQELNKPKPSPIPQVTIEAVTKKRVDKPSQQQPELSPAKKGASKTLLNPMAPLLASGLANDIDAATLAAFNQMFWLPYLGQMAPELFKAMAGLPNSTNLAEILPFLAQQQQQLQQQQQQQQQQQSPQPQAQRQQFPGQFNNPSVPNPMAFQNPLEFAMLQEALNQAQMQRALKMQRDQMKKNAEAKLTTNRNNYNMGMLFAQKGMENTRMHLQQQQQSQQQAKGRSMIGVNPFRQDQGRPQMRPCHPEKGNGGMRQMNPYYPPHTGMEISPVRKPKQSPQNEQKPRVTCKSLSNLLQPERLMQETKMSNLMAAPQFDFNQLHAHQQQQQQNQLPPHLHSQTQGSHQSQYSNHSNLPNSNCNMNAGHKGSGNTPTSSTGGHGVGKLKVKPAPHLLDPAAMQRRLLNYEEIPEVGSTTSGMDDIMNDPNAHLWHPLFGSTQKTGYNSPWQWTTVTATGE